jgi:hypothetical protein
MPPLEENVTVAPFDHVTTSVPDGLREKVVKTPLPPVSLTDPPLEHPVRCTVVPVLPLSPVQDTGFW